MKTAVVSLNSVSLHCDCITHAVLKRGILQLVLEKNHPKINIKISPYLDLNSVQIQQQFSHIKSMESYSFRIWFFTVTDSFPL